jgi:hypothetical protein
MIKINIKEIDSLIGEVIIKIRNRWSFVSKGQFSFPMLPLFEMTVLLFLDFYFLSFWLI